jgi:polyferredoxin
MLRVQSYLLLWLALLIVFTTSNPALAGFEPFATLFALRGSAVQWYLVTAAVLSSLVTPRLWCRFLCPVEGSLNMLAKVKRRLVGYKNRRQPEEQTLPKPFKLMQMTFADWTALGFSVVMLVLIVCHLSNAVFNR